jgi:hypothetical protein
MITSNITELYNGDELILQLTIRRKDIVQTRLDRKPEEMKAIYECLKGYFEKSV